MQELRFSCNYKKLHNQKGANLIFVHCLQGKELSKDYIEYDTDNKYKIESKQNYLYLLFIGDKMIPFSTIRKLNQENEDKYINKLENRFFKIVIEED